MNALSLLDFASAYISISEAPIISVDCSRRNDEDEDNFAGFGGSGVGTGPNTEDEVEADETDYDDPTEEDAVVLTSIRSSSNRCAVLKEPAKPEKPEEVVVQKPPTPSTKAPKETAQHTPSSTPPGRDENQLRPNGRQHWLLAFVNLVNKLPRLFYLLVQSKSLCLRGAFHHDIVV